METFREQFGFVVRTRREAAGLSQEALAERAGLHRTFVSLLERGKNNPSLWTVKVIADALGTTMSSLILELEGAGRRDRAR